MITPSSHNPSQIDPHQQPVSVSRPYSSATGTGKRLVRSFRAGIYPSAAAREEGVGVRPVSGADPADVGLAQIRVAPAKLPADPAFLSRPPPAAIALAGQLSLLISAPSCAAPPRSLAAPGRVFRIHRAAIARTIAATQRLLLPSTLDSGD